MRPLLLLRLLSGHVHLPFSAGAPVPLSRTPSKGGAPSNPGWFENLKAEPEATIQVQGEQVPVRATVAEGAERARLWSLMNEVWPAYDDYQANTEREIPVVVLTRRQA